MKPRADPTVEAFAKLAWTIAHPARVQTARLVIGREACVCGPPVDPVLSKSAADHRVTPIESVPNLFAMNLDPEVAAREYRERMVGPYRGVLPDAAVASMEEQFSGSCTLEIAAFRAFAKAVSEGADRFVVLDTAPTGHTILLLDSALAYHREVTRQASQMPESVEKLLPRLRDPDFTRVLVVTLPEATPVHEAARLQQDLRRAEIEPFAWLINQSLVPLGVTDPALRQRQHNELPFIDEVQSTLANRVALVPWQSEPPTGLAGLRRIVAADSSLTS